MYEMLCWWYSHAVSTHVVLLYGWWRTHYSTHTHIFFPPLTSPLNPPPPFSPTVTEHPLPYDEYTWQGFALWDTAAHTHPRLHGRHRGCVDVDLCMELRSKIGGHTIYVTKGVRLDVQDASSDLKVHTLASGLLEQWQNAPEWVRAGAKGLCFFANSPEVVGGVAQVAGNVASALFG